MRRLLIGTGLAVLGGAMAWSGAALAGGGRDAVSPGAMRRLVFYAVLEGCYDDGVATADVEKIVRPDPATGRPMHFVPGCPLCMPALDAFHAYRARPKFEGWKGGTDTFGEGLPTIERERLDDPAFKVRLDVLHSLIQRWVGRRLDLMRPSPEERARIAEWLKALASKGMAILEQAQQGQTPGLWAEVGTCAICDAASSAARK